jgi:hypothetical protein
METLIWDFGERGGMICQFFFSEALELFECLSLGLGNELPDERSAEQSHECVNPVREAVVV